MNRKKITIILCLGLIFAAPGIMAYLVYAYPSWLSLSRTNKGHLVSPRLITALQAAKPHTEISKWGIILFYPGECDIECLQELDRLNQIRLALGRKYYAIDLWLLNFQRVIGKLVKPQIWITTPTNYLILKYDLTAKSDDIFHDLYLLL